MNHIDKTISSHELDHIGPAQVQRYLDRARQDRAKALADLFADLGNKALSALRFATAFRSLDAAPATQKSTARNGAGHSARSDEVSVWLTPSAMSPTAAPPSRA